MKFAKPALSQQQLVSLLQQRGLPLSDPQDVTAARRALDRIGYFRLSGYMLPFQIGGRSGNRHHFRPGATINKILQLHALDSDLRLHLLQGLQQIEVAMRASICDHLSRCYGAHWQLNPKPFKPGKHAGNLQALADAAEFDVVSNKPLGRQSDTHQFITWYYSKYTNPRMPPGWMIRECATFRTWAFVFEALTSAEQKQISDAWRYPNGKRIDHSVLENWFHALGVMRNRCAHHSRITHHRAFTFAPTVPQERSVAHLFTKPGRDLRTFAVVIAIMLRSVDPASMWLRKLFLLLDWRSGVDLGDAAGFKDWGAGDWRNDPLWDF